VKRYAVRNGQLIDEEHAVVPVTVREVFFNFSVYESIKVLRETAVFLEDHIERLLESADRLEISHPFTSQFVRESMYLLIHAEKMQRGMVRVQLIGGREPMLFLYHMKLPAYPAAYYTRGIRTISYDGERIIPEVKSNCLLLNYVALREAAKRGAFEALLTDRHRHAAEGTRSNVFGIIGDRLVTAGEGVLAGVTRKHIIDAAAQTGWRIIYDRMLLEEMKNGLYDELFITSTSMGAMPISHIDDVCVIKQHQRESDQTRHPASLRLHAALRRLEAGYVQKCRIG